MNKAEKYFSSWFEQRGWTPFPFQKQVLDFYLEGYSGLLNAPTGSGKTFALWIPILIEWKLKLIKKDKNTGLQILWITPIRALVKDVKIAMQSAANELDIDWEIAARTGDTDTKERLQQKKNIPQCLITTPESLHIMLSQKNYPDFFKNIKAIVIDEWHELIGSKRGVQVELALSRLKGLNNSIKIWGISATIGNLEEASEVLLGNPKPLKNIIIKAQIDKKIEIKSIVPDQIEQYPWGGHLGIKLIDKVIPVIEKSKTTLVFTNTRAQTEIWYQAFLEKMPEWAGQIALHHGSLSKEIREWVESSLHLGSLKLVVCTSSLDLGVDFRPVETIVQVGGPKGVARFMQRAGRSGHQPGAVSTIYFVPGHSLELIEAAALRKAISEMQIESRIPLARSFDVLVQYMLTLACGDGFEQEQLFKEVKSTFAYESIDTNEWHELLQFITLGGSSLSNYEEYHKVIIENGIYKIENKKIAHLHRMSIGTIVSEPVALIKYMTGGLVGTVEEYFIAKLKIGDVFTFAGKNLEVVRIRNMELTVRKATKKTANIPSWAGGRMPLSSQLSKLIREKLTEAQSNEANNDEELLWLKPIFEKQREVSILPNHDEFLIEYFEGKEGNHLFGYTFEGRFVNEGIAALVSYRISNRITPCTFSISMTDYGFELLTDQDLPLDEIFEQDIFSTDNLITDMLAGLNSTEMARRKFRDIAHIAGLIFSGYPGKQIKNKHLQASARNFFDVYRDYEPNNLLFKQAYEEVLFDQLDESRLREALNRINNQKLIVKRIEKPSPLCFPIMVEMIREKSVGESMEDRVNKMLKKYKL